jgi:hypothetical protein
MENIGRVTDHLRTKCTGIHTSLSLVPTVDGGHFHVDESGEFWRMYRYLEGTRSYDSIPSIAHAREAAAEFGRFQAMLRDLPGPRLHETITGFHDTPARYAQLHESLASDVHDRVKHCAPEIDRALAWEAGAGSLIDLQRAGKIPERHHAQRYEDQQCHVRPEQRQGRMRDRPGHGHAGTGPERLRRHGAHGNDGGCRRRDGFVQDYDAHGLL